MEPEEIDSEWKPDEINEEALLPEASVEGSIRFRSRFRSCITIEPILFAIFLTDGLSDSVTINFILMRSCEVHFKFNKSICDELSHPHLNTTEEIEGTVQKYSANLLTGMNVLSIIFPAIISFFVGPWSDCNGRKSVIVVSALGFFFKYAILMILSLFPNLGPEYGLLVVIPTALSGGRVTFISSAYAYISDFSLEDNRSFRISVLEVVIYLSINIGFLSSPYIYAAGEIHGYLLIYGLCAFIVLIAVIPTYVFVPESLQGVESGKGLWHIFDFKLFIKLLHVIFKKMKGYQRAVIFLVTTVSTLNFSAGVGESSIIFLFTALRFDWDIREFNLWASSVLAFTVLGLIFGIFVFIKWLKISDALLGVLCFGLKTANSFYIAFIPFKAAHLMFYSGLISIFNGLCGPLCRAILSKSVPGEDLGKVFALMSSSESIFSLALGPLYTVLYNSTIETLPNCFLFVSGSFFFLCFILFIIIYVFQKKNVLLQYEKQENENENQ